MRIVLVGPPAAGKGTQAGRIVERFGGVHVATGDILRSNAERGTQLGRTASEFMDRGDLVPDEVMIDMVLERLGEDDLAGGFVLDGFPRTVPQAEALDRRLAELGRPLDAVVSLEIDEHELHDRLAVRAEEQDRTEDEDPDAIRRRLELFNRETEPLLDHYAGTGLLVRVDGEGEVDEVTERIAEALAGRGRGEVRRVMAINFDAQVRLTEALLPLLRRSAPSGIVFVGSVAGRVARAKSGAYSASKFALAGWSEALAMEERRHGVHVTLLQPGFFVTEGFPQRELLARPWTRWMVTRDDKVAEAVVDAWRHRRPERYVPRPYGLVPLARVLLPGLYRRGGGGGGPPPPPPPPGA